jgi:hypothetical protein
MSAAVVGIVGSLLGVALGFYFQYLQHRMQRQELLDDAKRTAYTNYLRAVDASYTQADELHQTERSEDGKITEAVAEIELLARRTIHQKVREHSDNVIEAHNMVARGDKSKVPECDAKRRVILGMFKDDLGIKDDLETEHRRPSTLWRRSRHK